LSRLVLLGPKRPRGRWYIYVQVLMTSWRISTNLGRMAWSLEHEDGVCGVSVTDVWSHSSGVHPKWLVLKMTMIHGKRFAAGAIEPIHENLGRWIDSGP
jgi:hypothetical protein